MRISAWSSDVCSSDLEWDARARVYQQLDRSRSLRPRRRVRMSEPVPLDRVKVAIIGSGPAGLSAAARAGQLGMSHVLLEKTDHLSDTIFTYKKGKRVLGTPERLDIRSDSRFAAGARAYTPGYTDEDAANTKARV